MVPGVERDCHCLLCDADGFEGRWAAREASNAQLVREHGWTITGVAGDFAIDWAYSIGLWHSFGSPEICLVGVPQRSAAKIVNKVAEQISRGDPLKPGEIRTGAMGGWNDTLALSRVHDSWFPRLFGAAIDFYQRPPIPMIQLVWLDGYGRFLWDPEVHPQTRDRQCSLWLPIETADHRWK